ncbi:MAG TPA: hypothetical protein PLB62_05960 [Candidatus Sumerlaeota bacterium]|nr:hypothetical protein [Candidatus Sumerlaeota bacterium]
MQISLDQLHGTLNTFFQQNVKGLRQISLTSLTGLTGLTGLTSLIGLIGLMTGRRVFKRKGYFALSNPVDKGEG